MKLLTGAVVLLGITCSSGYATLLYTSATTGVYLGNPLIQVPPGCVGSTVVGTAYAASSLGCVINGFSYSAFSVAQSGIGPLGIGVDVNANPGPWSSALSFDPYAGGQAMWDGTIIPTGGTGSGFIQFDYDYSLSTLYGAPNFPPRATFNGVSLCDFLSSSCHSSSPLLPIVFGTPYSLNLSAGFSISATSMAGAPHVGIAITGAQLYNANGTPLLNGNFYVTPEPASIILLLSALIIGWLLRVRTRKHKSLVPVCGFRDAMRAAIIRGDFDLGMIFGSLR